MGKGMSKSKYVKYCQCPKIIWLDEYNSEQATISPATKNRFAEGNKVGRLAMGLFGDYVEVTESDSNGKLNLSKMIKRTQECISNGVVNICEASFSYDGAYCAVDILHKVEDGYEIYEVKSSISKKKIHTEDIAYQKYILEKCGLKITKLFIVHINNNYVRHGDIDINTFFLMDDVTVEANLRCLSVEENIKKAKDVLAEGSEPNIGIDIHCIGHYDCPYKAYCMRDVPSPSVFDLYLLGKKTKYDFYKKGIVSFDDISNSALSLTVTQQRQVDAVVKNSPQYIDKGIIKKALDTFTYPLYFLDFESIHTCIPLFEGTCPNQQIPFQYSLHYIQSKNAELKHTEFLAAGDSDPRRELAERLVADIPQNACVLAYNMAFERSIIKSLAEYFSDLQCKLLTIRDNMCDLLPIFKDGGVYLKEMSGSFSIKSVLPAVFPNNPELSYHNLENVHTGEEATAAYLMLSELPPDEKQILRENLLAYCKLDTLAMVKLWQQLYVYLKS